MACRPVRGEGPCLRPATARAVCPRRSEARGQACPQDVAPYTECGRAHAVRASFSESLGVSLILHFADLQDQPVPLSPAPSCHQRGTRGAHRLDEE